MDNTIGNKFLTVFQSLVESFIDEIFDKKYSQFKSDLGESIESHFELMVSNIDWEEVIDDNADIDRKVESAIDNFRENLSLEEFYSFKELESRVDTCEKALDDVSPLRDLIYSEMKTDLFKKNVTDIIRSSFQENTNTNAESYVALELMLQWQKAKFEEVQAENIKLKKEIDKLNSILAGFNQADANSSVELNVYKNKAESLAEKCKGLESEISNLKSDLNSIKSISMKSI